jgi:hypothetical protein
MLVLKYVKEEFDYFKEIVPILKENEIRKICYISLNKSYEILKEKLRSQNIRLNNFFFVDCVSLLIKQPEITQNCDFIENPYQLDKISISIQKAIEKGYTLIIFDSLSSLYSQNIPAGANILIKFIRSFLSLLEERKGDAIFICRLKDKDRFIIQETLPIFEQIQTI